MQNKRLKSLKQLQARQQKLKARSTAWSKKVVSHQQARLGVALAFMISLVPLSMNANARSGFFVAGALLIVFCFLVYRTRSIVRFRNSILEFEKFNDRQILRLQGKSSGRSWKQAHEKGIALKIIPDLVLTGSHSLWTLLDETLTEGGQDELLKRFSRVSNDLKTIQSEQTLLQRSRPLRWFYTKLGLTLPTQELESTKTRLLEFIQTPTTGPSFSKLLALNLLVWIPTAIVFTLGYLRIIEPPNWVFLFFPLVSWMSLGSVATVLGRAIGLSHYLAVLNPLFKRIEKRSSYFSGLNEVCPTLLQVKPSKQVRRLETVLGFLGTQTNPLLHFVVNALTPWTLVSVFFLERIRLRLAQDFPTVLQELSNLEVLGTFLIFEKYQTQKFPELHAEAQLSCRQIFHPLIDQTKVVANDFSFNANQSLGLLTGSNMSGKSTFLRTIGINQILANMGAPIFAEEFKTTPFAVETCIEVSDSLRDGYSYFYSEVRRLKSILNHCRSSASVLFLIDEIFRGTNNKERQVGSRSVITQLAQSKLSMGFVSTHDLELTNLSEQNPNVVNLHFREDIDANGTMSFAYELKLGPSPTTNALRIMEAEGLIQ